MSAQLRIARPVSNLQQAASMYRQGLGLEELASFSGHEGFCSVLLGKSGAGYHIELTCCMPDPVLPTPTSEDLLVLFIPDWNLWHNDCVRMRMAGFFPVEAVNPYWSLQGKTFSDADGYRTVLCHGNGRTGVIMNQGINKGYDQ